MQISEDVIHLGLQPRSITYSEICIILHILRKPNSIIANYVINLLLIKFISSSFDKRALVNTQESVSLFIVLFFKQLFNFFVNFHSSARLNEYKILQKLLVVVVVVQLCLVLSRPDYQTTKSINS